MRVGQGGRMGGMVVRERGWGGEGGRVERGERWGESRRKVVRSREGWERGRERKWLEREVEMATDMLG